MTANVIHLNGEPLPTPDQTQERMLELLDKMREIVLSGQARVVVGGVLTNTTRTSLYVGGADTGWSEMLGVSESLKLDIWKEMQ